MLINKIFISDKEIEEFSKKWDIQELSLFGSILREDFSPESDIDILISFNPKSNIDLFDLVIIQNELQNLFDRKIDVIEKEAIKNPFRKDEILNNYRVIYAA